MTLLYPALAFFVLMVKEEMRRRACKSHEGEGERKRSETTAEFDGARSLGQVL